VLCLFIFRRDLRLDDNTGLIKALEDCEKVIPAFILDPRQVGNENEYKSEFAINFMINSLNELNDELRKRGSRLYVYFGLAEEVIKNLLKDVDAVYLNEDYTPFSKMRDERIRKYCEDTGKIMKSFEDYLLTSKNDFKNYRNFTTFYNVVKNKQIRKPVQNNYTNYL